MTLKTVTLIASNDGPIDAPVREHLNLPRSQIRALFQNSCVSYNGVVCLNPGTKVGKGEKVTLTYDDTKRYKEKKKLNISNDYSIIFEDGHLVVVNKSPGVLTVPTESGAGRGSSLIDQLHESISSVRSLEVIHRLDRDTSGLLVFAKSQGTANKLRQQFENRKPNREYCAIVRGYLKDKSGIIESYLSTDKDLNQYSVDNISDTETRSRAMNGAKYACTHYSVIQELNDASVLKIKLDTGRRNQIRVHFSERGNPVLGDKRYSPGRAKHPLWKEKSLALHATSLGFTHPVTGKSLYFESPLPERIKSFMSEAKKLIK
ncbi:MAG TPA: RluA family pseudouridine synthase [Oligoflexia bacterium]|nr:RluA family pseudouridine synthase [Oligoflexia bacterium]HMP47999.1 RluA family pseudouridine synthase [Oligoflexia bacterium]